jgi:hypothetical protein
MLPPRSYPEVRSLDEAMIGRWLLLRAVSLFVADLVSLFGSNGVAI